MEVEEEEYQAARRDRLRRDRLMEIDPLQLMFESENDAARRRVLQVCSMSKEEINKQLPSPRPPSPHLSTPYFRRAQRDLSLLMSLGFSQTMVQKSLFIASGVHAEALHWLIDNQHHPNVETPWNMTQLQVGWEKLHVERWPHA